MSQPIRVPDLEAQRLTMQRLDFLVGTWTGSARVLRGPGVVVEVDQTERAEYRLGGLVLLIEGTGCDRSNGAPVLQALGVLSYDDEQQTYRMRAFNDGRFLETEVRLPGPREMTWSFAFGDISTRSVLRVDDEKRWTEHALLTIGAQPPKTLLELSVRRQ